MSNPDARREAAAARKARFRARQRAGGAVLRVPIQAFNDLVEVLLDTGWLAEGESEDRAEVGRALGLLADDFVAHRVPRGQTRSGRGRSFGA